MNTATSPLKVLDAELEARAARAAAEEDLFKEATIEQFRRLTAAGDEPGFCGDVRRAIHSSGIRLEKIAETAGMTVFALCDFLEGTADLTSTQLAAIVQLLGLQLVRPLTTTTSPRRKQGP